MADSLADALARAEQMIVAENPWYSSGRALESINVPYDPYTDTSDQVFGNLITGLLGGFGTGFGREQIRDDLQELHDGYRTGLSSEDPIAGLRGSDNRYVQSLAAPLQQKLFDDEQEFAKDLRLHNAKARTDSLYDHGRVLQDGQFSTLPSFIQGEVDSQQALALANRGMDNALGLGLEDQIKLQKAGRDEMRKLASYQNFAEVDAKFQEMTKHRNNFTAAADIALINAFAKIMDPGSVVREGEVKAANKASPFWTRWGELISSVAHNKERLSPATRDSILAVAKDIKNEQQRAYNRDAQGLVDIYGRQKVNPEDILLLPINEIEEGGGSDGGIPPGHTVGTMRGKQVLVSPEGKVIKVLN